MTTRKIEVDLAKLVPAWNDFPKENLLIKKMQKLHLRFLYEKQDCDRYKSIAMPLARTALMESYGNLMKLYKKLENEILCNNKSREIICKDYLAESHANMEKADMLLTSEVYTIAVFEKGNQFQINFCENA